MIISLQPLLTFDYHGSILETHHLLWSKYLPSEMKWVDSYNNNYFPIQLETKKDVGDMAENKMYFLEAATDLNRETWLWEGWSWSVSLVMHPCKTVSIKNISSASTEGEKDKRRR